MRGRARLSYTEVVVIVVVLGAFAIGVVPRFTEASAEFRTCDLIDGLEQMRAQLDLYSVQHGGCLGDFDSFISFQTAMTTKIGQYGRYVKSIPVNPFNNLNTVRFDGKPAGAGIAGWRLDTAGGLFQADDCDAHACL